MGLDDILSELYAEGRKPTDETAEEIINRLEAKRTLSLPLNVSAENTPMSC